MSSENELKTQMSSKPLKIDEKTFNISLNLEINHVVHC